MNKVTDEKLSIIVSMLIVLVLLCFSWTFCRIGFETNDDTGILMFVTGAKTGAPTAETIFCNILWGTLLSFLYRINETIPWYTGIYMLIIWIVLSIVCYICMRFFASGNANETKKERFVKIFEAVKNLVSMEK